MTLIDTIKKRPTDEDIVKALKASSGIKAGALQWLKQNGMEISRKTLYRRIKASEELQNVAYEADEIILDVAENKLLELVKNGDRTAIIFYLKCKGKKRGYVERQEIMGEVKAVTKNPFKELSTEELKKLAKADG